MSSAGSGRLAMGATPPTASGDGYGIFMDGAGQFSFQATSSNGGDAYIRNDAEGFAMSFPSFSVTPAGYLTAEDATFKGHIEAATGFIGSSTTTGWNIDGSTITDLDNIIVLDATSGSANITITSGSFFAEMVPDFTHSDIILSGGGNAFTSASSAALMDTGADGDFTFYNNNGAAEDADVKALPPPDKIISE
jgi:hypothetical protein